MSRAMRGRPLFIWAVCALGLVQAIRAQDTNSPIRSITLQECIQLALAQNLDLQIQRIDPLLKRLDLELARAGYDAGLSFSAEHRYSETGGSVNTNGMLGPDSRLRTDSFGSGISGLGPMGLLYDL